MVFKLKHNFIILSVLISFILLSIFLVLFSFGIMSFGEFSIDNAYIKSKMSQISARVSSKIIKINVKDFDSVKKGDILFVLDSDEFKQNLQKAKAKLSSANEDLNIFYEQQEQLKFNLKSKNMLLKIEEANNQNNTKEYERAKRLLSKNAISQKAYDEIFAQYKSQEYKLELANLGVLNAKAELKMHNEKEAKLKANINLAKAELELAKLKLEQCNILAPFDGVLGEILVGLGELSNKVLVKEISDEKYIIANVKEKDINRIKIGDGVKFSVDAFDEIFEGKIISVAPATGSEFSAIKIDNSVGNFVKITQKIPVKIQIITKDERLKSGMSVRVVFKDKNSSKNQ